MESTRPTGDHSELAEHAIRSAREAGDWLLTRFGQRIPAEPKGDDSVVTAFDVESERLIAQSIRSRFPHHEIIGEESNPGRVHGACTWVIDPINGTRNFAAGVPLWAVSVAALEGDSPVAGAIYLPVTGELFHAVAGGGAFLDETRLRVGGASDLSQAVVMTDLLPRTHRNQGAGVAAAGMIGVARRTRMFGSVCCALCYVASGRFDLYYRPTVNLWDVAAGALIVREAGGQVCAFDGSEWHAGSDSILAANPALIQNFNAERRKLEGSAGQA